MPSKLPDNILGLIEKYDIDLIRFLYIDLSGQIRGKVTSGKTFADRTKTGIGLVKGMIAMNMLDQMQTDTGFGATGEVRMVPDLNSFRPLTYSEPQASVICDLIELDKNAWEFCPRSLLRKMIGEIESLGYSIQGAFEPEYMLGKLNEENNIFPLDTNVCFGTDAMDRASHFYNDLSNTLKSQGIEIEQMYPELGHGQHELSVKYAPALEACDNYITVKEALRALALRNELFFTASPKPFESQPGNGCHLHLSIWDKDLKNNETWADDETGLSKVAKNFIAGLLNHLPALVSITCPSVNSYKRLQPRSWSSAFACWGLDNREAAVRVPSVYWGKEKESTNIEIKCVDNTINPYLAMAAVIASGIDGIKKDLSPPPPVDCDPMDLSEAEMKESKVVRLPDSLNNALIELETDLYLKSAIGEELANAYITVKTSEVNSFALDSDFEYEQHRLRY